MKLKGLQNGETFTGFVVVRQSNVATTKDKSKKYVDVKVFDGETEISGKIWDHEGTPPILNEVAKIQAIIGEYNGNPQLTVQQWRQAREDEYSPAEFLPVYQGDRETLFIKLLAAANSIVDPNLKSLVTNLLNVHEAEILDAPAAMVHHHAYIGGLLEHSNNVLCFALDIASNSPEYVDTDLIKAGAILHDIGKIITYTWKNASIEMSDDGQFLDHIVLGIMMVHSKSVELNIPWETTRNLLHTIAAHHGSQEHGSPVEPALKEAWIIHQADLIDATMFKVTTEIASGIEQNKQWVRPRGFRKALHVKK